jgi:hypothetical protein
VGGAGAEGGLEAVPGDRCTARVEGCEQVSAKGRKGGDWRLQWGWGASSSHRQLFLYPETAGYRRDPCQQLPQD